MGLEPSGEWEVVSRSEVVHADVARLKDTNLRRSDSVETTELLARVDSMKESVEEQKALRMLERENALELLDYGGTGGPTEQEAALLLERVDQGFTQIITDSSEVGLMTSLHRELTPEKQTLAEHERDKIEQPELMRQIQEKQPSVELDDKHASEQNQMEEQIEAMLKKEDLRKKSTETLPSDEVFDGRKAIEVLQEQPVIVRRKRSEKYIELVQPDIEEAQLVSQRSDFEQELRRLSVEYQKLMWESEKQSSMETLAMAEEETIAQGDEILVNLLPKGGRVDPDMEFEPIAAMKKTITRMKEETTNQQVLKQLSFLNSCVQAIETKISQMKVEKSEILDVMEA